MGVRFDGPEVDERGPRKGRREGGRKGTVISDRTSHIYTTQLRMQKHTLLLSGD